jgi:hypothetical protein
MPGLAFSNSLTWFPNCVVAAFVLPGISDATLIVTGPFEAAEAALEIAAVAQTARTLAAVTAAVSLALRVDFIATPSRVRRPAAAGRESMVDLSIAVFRSGRGVP